MPQKCCCWRCNPVLSMSVVWCYGAPCCRSLVCKGICPPSPPWFERQKGGVGPDLGNASHETEKTNKESILQIVRHSSLLAAWCFWGGLHNKRLLGRQDNQGMMVLGFLGFLQSFGLPSIPTGTEDIGGPSLKTLRTFLLPYVVFWVLGKRWLLKRILV